MMLLKKTVYDKSETKVSAKDSELPSTNRLVTKTQYDSSNPGLNKNTEDIFKKIFNTIGLVRRLIKTQK